MRCGIGLGSNLGDRLENLRLARRQLLAAPEWLPADAVPDRCLCASVYETEPVGCPPDSGGFLNTVLDLAADPDTTPWLILARLQSIEVALGRPSRHPRNAPRSIDLDLLYLGNLECSTPELTLPHPRLRTRRFVLAPLAEIRPGLVLPGDPRPMAELWQKSSDTSRVARLTTIW
jgi:2-amino-4-hydroxy-6-hydroxymethyldihydropteridine diphosphokinase